MDARQVILMEVPFCSNCQRDVTTFTAFYPTQCSHLYCEQCFATLGECPIDKSTWNNRSRTQSRDLAKAVSVFRERPTSATLELLMEMINFTDVRCKYISVPSHRREICKYDHSEMFNSQESIYWMCPKCNIKNDVGSIRCSICSSLGPMSQTVNPSRPAAASPSSRRRPSPEPAARLPQTWVCRHCMMETTEESHLCWNCAKTNTEIKAKLDSEGRSMKICPKCKKLSPFSSQKCTECKAPMSPLREEVRGPNWQCSSCQRLCSDMGSWICSYCSKTDLAQQQALRAAGKEMVPCPNRQCQKLCARDATMCNGCYSQLPQRVPLCGKCRGELFQGQCLTCEQPQKQCQRCGTVMDSGRCVNCETMERRVAANTCETCGERTRNGHCGRCEDSMRAKVCEICGFQVLDGICLNCSKPPERCKNCGNDMPSGRCENCANILGRRSPTVCPKCRGRLTSGRCSNCERKRPRACGTCGLELTGDQCSNCEAKRHRRKCGKCGKDTVEGRCAQCERPITPQRQREAQYPSIPEERMRPASPRVMPEATVQRFAAPPEAPFQRFAAAPEAPVKRVPAVSDTASTRYTAAQGGFSRSRSRSPIQPYRSNTKEEFTGLVQPQDNSIAMFLVAAMIAVCLWILMKNAGS